MNQAVNGILLLDKATGYSSNAQLQRVKRFFKAKKAGHTGSLDPLATGMLPICFGEATKYAQYLLDGDKCYEVTAKLGCMTDTGDSMGQVISVDEPQPEFSLSQIQNVLIHLTGEMHQVPPMYSALKHKGRPLYHYARQGIDIERKARIVSIISLECLAFDGVQLKLRVQCTKGTYIRTLVESIGEQLGVGAHVTQLHRCYTQGFESEAMVSLQTLLESTRPLSELMAHYLLPVDRAVMQFPELRLSHELISALQCGQTVTLDAFPNSTDDIFRLYTEQNEFMGLIEHRLEQQAEHQNKSVLKAFRLMSASRSS